MTNDRDPGDISEIKFKELIGFMKKNSARPSRIFIIGKKFHLKIGGGDYEEGYTVNDYGIIIPRHFDRGEILDLFSKIELFVDEIILTKILKVSYNSIANDVEFLLDKINFYQKIKLLSDTYNLIDNNSELYKRILLIKKVRDSLAHLWNIDKVYYKNPSRGILKDNFQDFKDDLVFVWKGLIETYEEIVNQDELMDNAIKFLKKMIKGIG